MCSAFRTFQGWTALSDMQPTEGVSRGDFAAEDYEVSWTGRPTVAYLSATGRRQLGL